MAIKVVTLNAEPKGFSLSWETTNKKNRKHLMRHFLEISSASEIMDIAESLGCIFDVPYTLTKAERLAAATEWLVESLQDAVVQASDCEIPVAELPYKYCNLVHKTERSTDPFPSKR
jgi:hypothetical protein